MTRMAGPHDLRNAAELAPDTLARLSGESVTDDELLVGERSALDAFFDVANGRRLALALWVLAATLAIYAVVEFVSGSMLRGTIAGLGVIGDLTLLRFRSRPAVADNVRQTAAAVLLGHLIVLQLFHGSAAGGIGFWFVVFPLIAVRFRLASGETVALFASLYAVVRFDWSARA
jgi:hypothetical protein